MIKLSESFLRNLKLLEKSINKPGKFVSREDLPNILWGNAPRKIKGSKWFKEEADNHHWVYSKNLCESCGELSNSCERHELYGLYSDENENIYIKYEGLMMLCKKCHSKIHFNLSNKIFKQSLIECAPQSNKMRNTELWNSAIGLIIGDELYSFEELNVNKKR